MADHEMLNLDEMGTLKDSMELLGEELMNGHRINPNLYVEYDVKRGLRDSAGKGVLTGLTEISDVTGYDLINGRKIPAHGRLYYQGYNVNDIVDGLKGRKFGFEETIYLRQTSIRQGHGGFQKYHGKLRDPVRTFCP